MMYYRVAIRRDISPCWRWESRVIASLDALFRVLRLYRSMPWDHIRVFFSSSVEYMDEMLARENKGLASNSITAERLFNSSKQIQPCEENQFESELGTSKSMVTVVTSILSEQALYEQSLRAPFENSMSFVEMRRLELELGASGDHDTPYTFTLPPSMPQVLAWTKLLARVRRGELEP